METERRSPIVNHQRHFLLCEAERSEPGVEIADMVSKPIRTIGRLARIAHAGEIRCETSRLRRQVGNDVAPEVGRGRIAM